MSIYRQLWLSIFVSMLVAMLATQIASLVSARAYLEAQLTMKNRDTATSLALALSQGQSDQGRAVTAARALFDSGYYDLVRVADPQGRSLLELVSSDHDTGVPGWFSRLLPIQAVPGQAEITNGFQQVGRLTVLSRSRFAYHELWTGVWSITAIMLFGATLGGVLGSLVLGRIRKPMQAVIAQAQAIMEHRFIRIEEPNVPELRQLAQAMNDTVGRLRQRFDEDAEHYESLRRQANYEALTGLARRRFFMTNLQEMLSGEEAREGNLVLVRVSDLGIINRQLGREATDDLIKRLAASILTVVDTHPNALAGHINGADFAVLPPPENDPGKLAEVLMKAMHTAAEPCRGVSLYIVHAHFLPGETTASLFARVDDDLSALESTGISAVREARPATGLSSPVTASQWRDALLRAHDEPGWCRLLTHPLYFSSGDEHHLECPLSLQIEGVEGWQPASRFMPVAERLGLSTHLDRVAVSLAMNMLREQPELSGLWLHLSGQSLSDEAFRKHVLTQLDAERSCATRLWLQVPEVAAIAHIEVMRDWVKELKPLGGKMGIAHCGHRFDRIGLFYELGLDFLKVDASFVHDIGNSPGNRAFLSGFCDIAHRIGLKVIAEGVGSETDLRVALDLGFDAVTGQGVHAS